MPARIIIEGITTEGRQFRPSDWAERMCGALSKYGRDHRINYSPLLHPLTINGIKCVSIDPSVEQLHPEMFSYIMHFAKANKLTILNYPPPGQQAHQG